MYIIYHIEDAPFVTRQLNDKVGEAASAAGVKEDQGRTACHEPPTCIVALRHSRDRAAQAAQGGGQMYQPIVLQRFYPFGVIADGGVYSSVAPGGAGDALIVEIDLAG